MYGRFSEKVEAARENPETDRGPLLLQTAACGPAGPISSDVPPNFRYVTVDARGAVYNLRPCNLGSLPEFGRLTSKPASESEVLTAGLSLR